MLKKLAFKLAWRLRNFFDKLAYKLAPPIKSTQPAQATSQRAGSRRGFVCCYFQGCQERATNRAGRLLTPYCATHAIAVEKEFVAQLDGRYRPNPRDRGVS